jgi:spore coat polysaccharide biosynthesis protein SpsF
MVKRENFTVAVLQARMSSSRLPNKVMLKVNGQPMIYWQIKRIKQALSIDHLVVATSTDSTDDPLVEFLTLNEVDVFRGSLNDVLSRFISVQEKIEPTAIIRLTADCPFVMPELIDRMAFRFHQSEVDCLSNTVNPTYPDGLDIEIVKATAMIKLNHFELTAEEREHVTLGIYRRPNLFTIENFQGDEDLSENRWTVDYLEDLEFVRLVFGEFVGKEPYFTLEDTLLFLKDNPNLKSAISGSRRNEKLDNSRVGK